MAQNIQTGVALEGGNKIIAQGGIDFSAASIAYEIAIRFWYLIEGVIILIVGLLVMRFIRGYLQRIQTTHENQRMAINLIEKVTSGFLLVITVTLSLKVIGLDMTLLISSVALGLSFGLQDIIKNYVSGILILFKSPFSIGDIVKIRSFIGRVEQIDFQSTTIKTFDNKIVTIYNMDILSQSITNYSKQALRRLDIAVTLGRGSDLQRAVAVFEKILQAHPVILKDPRFSIIFEKFTEYGPKLKVRFWVQKPLNINQIRSEVAFQLEQAFDEDALISSYARSIQFTQDISLNEGRKNRIRALYELPMLADLSQRTSEKVAVTLADGEEPEAEEMS